MSEETIRVGGGGDSRKLRRGPAFIWIDNGDGPTIENVRIADNYFSGLPTAAPAHIHIDRDDIVVRETFMMSLSEAHRLQVIALVERPRGRWRRMWHWIARFALRRAQRS